jgi:RNA polymerase sigma-70 factor (ECF subfamily)
MEHSDLEQYRRELLVHCYRMLGSLHDAEDLVQETFLRAWRSADSYDESRASLRTWLYRIATNACLTALKGRSRRALPSNLVGPSADAQTAIEVASDVPWLQPFPTDPLKDHGSLRLALIAAMQYLPARQRAVLVLRDVLDWPAADVAEALETTTTSVNSALQRARARLAEVDLKEDDVAEPEDRDTRKTIDSYIAAFEAADIDGLTKLLAEQVVLEMPPAPLWFVGKQAYGEFIARVYSMRGPDWRLVPTTANGQPAVGAYAKAEDGVFRAHSLQVFEVTDEGITHNVTFFDQGLFASFGLELHLE